MHEACKPCWQDLQTCESSAVEREQNRKTSHTMLEVQCLGMDHLETVWRHADKLAI